MQDLQPIGKVLTIVGILITVVGLVIWSGDKVPLFKFFGKLPGDISVEKENFRFYFPLATSIIVSVILSLIFWLARKF